MVVKTTTKKPWSWWGRNGLEKNDLENDYENDLEKNGLEKTLINDETVESMAFEICNTDGVDGLSWAEVEQCEVSIIAYICTVELGNKEFFGCLKIVP